MTQGMRQIEGYVLAGGESSRMGRDKAMLELDGVPLNVRAARLVDSIATGTTIVGAPERFNGLAWKVIADDSPGAGPLGGIATALRALRAARGLLDAAQPPGAHDARARPSSRPRLAQQKGNFDLPVRWNLHCGLQNAARIEASTDAVGQRIWAGKRGGQGKCAVPANELRAVASA